MYDSYLYKWKSTKLCLTCDKMVHTLVMFGMLITDNMKWKVQGYSYC